MSEAAVAAEVPHIDLDRGVTIRHTRDGIRVCMYKDEPGVYYTASGARIGENAARDAGFPVEDMRRVKLMRQQQADAVAEIERRFNDTPAEDVAVVDDWVLRHEGLGRHHIYDPNGTKVTREFMSLEEATIIMERITGQKVVIDTPLEGETQPEAAEGPAEPLGTVHVRAPLSDFVPPFRKASKGFGRFIVEDSTGRKAFPLEGFIEGEGAKDRAIAKAEELNAGV